MITFGLNVGVPRFCKLYTGVIFIDLLPSILNGKRGMSDMRNMLLLMEEGKTQQLFLTSQYPWLYFLEEKDQYKWDHGVLEDLLER